VEPPLIKTWISEFVEFLKSTSGEDFRIGIIETCEVEAGDLDIEEKDKLLFIVPAKDFPPNIALGSCDDDNATKVKFFYANKPFRYIHKITIK